jgi:hypothetical protein
MTATQTIESRAQAIAGCIFEEAEGTLVERLQECIDWQNLGTDGDLSDDDRAQLRELLAEAEAE